MTPGEINKKGAYPDYTDEQVHGVWPWDLEKYKNGNYYEAKLFGCVSQSAFASDNT